MDTLILGAHIDEALAQWQLDIGGQQSGVQQFFRNMVLGELLVCSFKMFDKYKNIRNNNN